MADFASGQTVVVCHDRPSVHNIFQRSYMFCVQKWSLVMARNNWRHSQDQLLQSSAVTITNCNKKAAHLFHRGSFFNALEVTHYVAEYKTLNSGESKEIQLLRST